MNNSNQSIKFKNNTENQLCMTTIQVLILDHKNLFIIQKFRDLLIDMILN